MDKLGETFEVEIIRDVIKLPSVRGEMLEENIAYVRLSRFATDSQEEMTALLEELLAENQPVSFLTCAAIRADRWIRLWILLTNCCPKALFSSNDLGTALNNYLNQQMKGLPKRFRWSC